MVETRTFFPVPRVNINGTSRDTLSAQYFNALTALREAQTAMAATAPHSRDYQTLPADHFPLAQEQHQVRNAKLEAIFVELLTVAEEFTKVNRYKE